MHHSALFCHQYALRIVLSQTFETTKFALTAALWCGLDSWQCCVSQWDCQFTGLVQSITYKPCIWFKQPTKLWFWFTFMKMSWWLMASWLRCDICCILHELTCWAVTFADTDYDKTKGGVEVGRNMIWVKRHHLLISAWLVLWHNIYSLQIMNTTLSVSLFKGIRKPYLDSAIKIDLRHHT